MFYIGVYDEWEQLEITVRQILEKTDKRIFIRSDGNYHPEIGNRLLYLSSRVLILRSQLREKVKGQGGRYTSSWMSAFFNMFSMPYVIKVDPDTGINHEPTLPFPIPEFDIACNYVKGSLRGGAIALTRPAIKRILQSEILFDPKYQDLRWCYRWRNQEWISCEDAILYDVAEILDLRLVHWNDVYCCHANEPFNPPNPLDTYSLYHPIQS